MSLDLLYVVLKLRVVEVIALNLDVREVDLEEALEKRNVVR